MVPNLITMIIFISIRFEYESFEMFKLFLLPILLSTVSTQSIGHLLAVVCRHNTVKVVIIIYILILLYSGVFTNDDDLFVSNKIYDHAQSGQTEQYSHHNIFVWLRQVSQWSDVKLYVPNRMDRRLIQSESISYDISDNFVHFYCIFEFENKNTLLKYFDFYLI